VRALAVGHSRGAPRITHSFLRTQGPLDVALSLDRRSPRIRRHKSEIVHSLGELRADVTTATAANVTDDAVAIESAFLDYFRCPVESARFELAGDLSEEKGYFTVDGTTAYGRQCSLRPARYATDRLSESSSSVDCDGRRRRLPFGLSEVIVNLQHEKYRRTSHHWLERLISAKALRQAYNGLRPLLSVPIRKPLRRMRLSGWDCSPFPHWPVDL